MRNVLIILSASCLLLWPSTVVAIPPVERPAGDRNAGIWDLVVPKPGEEGPVKEPAEQPVHEANKPGPRQGGGDESTYAELDWSQTKKPSKAGATGGDRPAYAELDWSQTKKPSKGGATGGNEPIYAVIDKNKKTTKLSEGAPNKPKYTERDGKLFEGNGNEERILSTEPPSFRDHPHARWFVKDAKTGAWYRTKYVTKGPKKGTVLRHKDAILTPPGGSKPNTQSGTSRDPQPGTSGLQPTFESTMLNAAKKLGFKVDTLEQFQQMHPREYEPVANKIRSKFPDQGKVGGATGGTQPTTKTIKADGKTFTYTKEEGRYVLVNNPHKRYGIRGDYLVKWDENDEHSKNVQKLTDTSQKDRDASRQEPGKTPGEQSNQVQKKKDESRQRTEADFEALLEEHGQGTDVKAKRNLGKRLYATLKSLPNVLGGARPRVERAQILEAINSIGYNFEKARDARKAIPEIYLEVQKYLDHQRRIENPWLANGFSN
ncbi:hypothetical protein G6O67_005653 [Ophiocordyceps sinensis]|uniref:Uncharacterized protein n=2 Tax=Ophiocordyceps sinensis TaxID=72228 RepID=A0A8H4LWQ0_9HYPO|nr:hypothetical protein OCS_03927 [Ophiocordyceps sinensis CO18]KAF4506973.1 hypothetical protein G6O67_005653 [Ophiocordyceps sinensis]